jgi:hypothetical protein
VVLAEFLMRLLIHISISGFRRLITIRFGIFLFKVFILFSCKVAIIHENKYALHIYLQTNHLQ